MSLSVETPDRTDPVPGTRASRPAWSVVRDYVELTKPSINRMCILMTAGGMFLAPRGADGAFPLSIGAAILALLGTAMAVASANALNMWLERGTDGLMRRTRNRPLAAGRISETGALVFGVAIGVIGVAILAACSNLATTLLGLGAIASYVGVYTPMKYKSTLALVVGAIPGAVPPLMGWTAVTGTLDAPGLILFGVLFVWQMPHFIAISVVRKRDYEAAGIKTVPGVRGLRNSKIQAILWALAILPVSLALPFTGVAGWVYGVTAAIAGLGFIVMTVRGPWPAASDSRDNVPDNVNRWAHKLFIASLIYLPVLIAGLSIDVLL
jgi:protoheme IX farnesyltransferase